MNIHFVCLLVTCQTGREAHIKIYQANSSYTLLQGLQLGLFQHHLCEQPYEEILCMYE